MVLLSIELVLEIFKVMGFFFVVFLEYVGRIETAFQMFLSKQIFLSLVPFWEIILHKNLFLAWFIYFITINACSDIKNFKDDLLGCVFVCSYQDMPKHQTFQSWSNAFNNQHLLWWSKRCASLKFGELQFHISKTCYFLKIMTLMLQFISDARMMVKSCIIQLMQLKHVYFTYFYISFRNCLLVHLQPHIFCC